MAKNIIKLNIDTNQIDEKIINQALVKGQHNYYEFEFHFYKNGNLYYDENLLFYVVFERADGEKTNKILLLRRGEIYYKKVNEWISDIVGELKISVQILDTQGDVIEAFPLITENVADGLRPSNTTIDEVQYDGILNDINEVNNALEEHKLDTDNPHETTAHQVGSYTQSEIDQIKVDIINYINTGLNQLEISKQDKLVAGDNITIDENNVISASSEGNSYDPDGVTIVLNEKDKLKVSENLEIDGGYL